MLKYFFTVFAFLGLIVLAMAGFRGAKSTRPPIEIFPDMDRQPKVKAQTPSGFFANGSAARHGARKNAFVHHVLPNLRLFYS